MSYHQRIMNIAANPPGNWSGESAYKIGHRDARHAAAEVAAEADAEVERLTLALSTITVERNVFVEEVEHLRADLAAARADFFAVAEARKTLDDLRHRLVDSEAENDAVVRELDAAVRELRAYNDELEQENYRLKKLLPTFSSEEDLLGGRTQRLGFTVHVTEEQLTQANRGALIDYLVSSFRESVEKTLREA